MRNCRGTKGILPIIGTRDGPGMEGSKCTTLVQGPQWSTAKCKLSIIPLPLALNCSRGFLRVLLKIIFQTKKKPKNFQGKKSTFFASVN